MMLMEKSISTSILTIAFILRDIMGKIAIKNHEENGVAYPKILPYIKNMIWLRSYTKKLKKLNKEAF